MEKLAIIGTGIAGLGSAYLLNNFFDITVFEKNNYVGGHTNTIVLQEDGKDIFVDTGFMVFNYKTYPNLTKLFKNLNVEVIQTDMSFGVQHIEDKLEYTGSGLQGLFIQKKNLLNFPFIKMLFKINKFNNDALKFLQNESYKYISLEEFVIENKYGNDFLYKYLIPMSSAVWSTPPDLMLKFPASTLLQFFYNHGFLGLNTQHQWYTVKGGSRNYRDKILKLLNNDIIMDGVCEVERVNGGINIKTVSGETHTFDKVIFATHGDQVLSILKNPSTTEINILSNFKYQMNVATLHTDDSIMPDNKKAWASWNYRIENKDSEIKTSTIYWMNNLQKVSDKKNYFVSINDPGNIDKSHIIKIINYEHPLFDVNAIKAQETIHLLNEQNNDTFYCGSYFKYGFHEDAFASAVSLTNKLTEGKAIL